LKKQGYSKRPPNRGDQQGRRQQNDAQRTDTRRKGRPNPRVNNQAVQQWMTSSPQTLTSHLPILSRKKNEGAVKKTGPQGKGQDRHRNPSRPGGERPNGYGNRGPARTGGDNQPRPESRASQPPVTDREKPLTGDLDPFELFCAYHLGIAPNKEYRPSNINDVAQRFGKDPATIRQALKEAGMDSASLLDRDFDMALAQLDIQVAPEGVDRIELAKTIYSDYLDAPYQKRDWNKILEEDRKENRKVFGDR